MKLFLIQKRIEVAGSHQLDLPYDSKCCRPHGHNWLITIHCAATKAQVEANSGMVIDFTEVKRQIHDVLDHQFLNEILSFNSTAENIAEWICNRTPRCYRVDVQESEGNTATYIHGTPEEVVDYEKTAME